MPTRIKNDPSRYRSRASLASSAATPDPYRSVRDIEQERSRAEKRDEHGIIDYHWYIRLPRKRK